MDHSLYNAMFSQPNLPLMPPLGHNGIFLEQPQNNYPNACPNPFWIPQHLSYFVPQYSFGTALTPPFSPRLSQLDTQSITNWDPWGNNYLSSFYSPICPRAPSPLSPQFQSNSRTPKFQSSSLKVETPNGSQQSSKKSKTLRKKIIDKDYLPHQPDKKTLRKRLHENQNRNVIPNEINQIISYLQKRTKSGNVLERLWKKYQPEDQMYSVQRFYLYQNALKEKIGHYSNEASLKLLNQLYEPQCRIWPQAQQRHYIKLSRMLVGHFLREDSIFIILTSKRMKSQKKLEHLRARRQVTRRVLKLLDHKNQA